MSAEYKKFYFAALIFLLVISIYPLANGARIMYLYIINGAIKENEYARYVIPYAAMCFSVIAVTALQPVFLKVLKRFQLFVLTALSLGIFGIAEFFFEGIKIINSNGVTPMDGASASDTIDVWQAALCYVSPDAIKAAQQRQETYAGGNGFHYVVNNASYKIHYFLVSIVIIMLITSVIYGLGKMAYSKDYANKKPVILQLFSAAALIALCIFANTTGFFRDISPIQTPLASALTCVFFIVLGVSFGVYIGSFLLKKGKFAGLYIPATASLLITCAMYYGESLLMGGALYRFGTGWFFTGIPYIIAAPADILVILLTGIITYLLFYFIRKK